MASERGDKDFAVHAYALCNTGIAAIKKSKEGVNLAEVQRLQRLLESALAEIKHPGAPQELIGFSGVKWSYLEPGNQPPQNWYSPETKVDEWKQGEGPLGYGEKDLKTTLAPGGTEKERPITAYFRTTFVMPAESNQKSLQLGLRRDDGVVVYLNGKEVFRDNMPEGVILPETLAAKTLGDEQEPVMPQTSLPMEAVVPGTNVLAIEVHQAAAKSSDLTMNAQLMLKSAEGKHPMELISLDAMKTALGKAWSLLPEKSQAFLESARKNQ
jgi:hypothetical protein